MKSITLPYPKSSKEIKNGLIAFLNDRGLEYIMPEPPFGLLAQGRFSINLLNPGATGMVVYFHDSVDDKLLTELILKFS